MDKPEKIDRIEVVDIYGIDMIAIKIGNCEYVF